VKKKLITFLDDQQGSTLLFVAVAMMVFFGFMALAIDTGHWFAVKNELHNAGDACALRGARAYYPDNISETVQNINPNPATAQTGANTTIDLNSADTQGLSDLTNLETGIWNYQTRTLEPWNWPPAIGSFKGPGVTLSTRKQSGVNAGPVNNFFGTFLNVNTTDIGTVSAAALSGVGGVNAAQGWFPIAVNESLVKDTIYFNPDTLDVGGWTSMTEDQASASVFKQLIDGSVDGTGPNPTVDVNDIISLQNGVACTAIKEIIKAYKLVESNTLKGCYPSNIVIKFPVVEVDKFNQSASVKGFMAATVVWVRDSNAVDQTYNGKLVNSKCSLILENKRGVVGGTKGGGPYYGLMSVQPKLVQ